MQLFDDLKYIGNDVLAMYEGVWHCTQFVTRLGEEGLDSNYIVQQPHCREGRVIGYDGLNSYVLTEQQLVRDFKIINKDGSLENIEFRLDEETEEMFNAFDKMIENMSEEEFEEFLNSNE